MAVRQVTEPTAAGGRSREAEEGSQKGEFRCGSEKGDHFATWRRLTHHEKNLDTTAKTNAVPAKTRV